MGLRVTANGGLDSVPVRRPSDVAAEQPVLLFTCHPETASLLEQLRPGTRIIEIGSPEPSRQMAIR